MSTAISIARDLPVVLVKNRNDALFSNMCTDWSCVLSSNWLCSRTFY